MSERSAPSFDLLEWLGPKARTAFVAAARNRPVQAGALIYQQGDEGREIYRILDGKVRLSVAREDGREIVFLLFGKGDCFGVSSLIDDDHRPQTAEAVDDCVLQVVDRAGFQELRGQYREFDASLLRLLALQMRVVSARFIDASLTRLAGRIGTCLLEYAQPCQSGMTHSRMTVRMSQTELAALVGASRQSVNRVLQQMQDQKLVRLEYNAVHLSSPESLRAMLV